MRDDASGSHSYALDPAPLTPAVKLLMHIPHQTSLRTSVTVIIVLLAVSAALVIGSVEPDTAWCNASVVGTNVVRVYANVTHGPVHTFFYPSRFRCMCDLVGQRLGFRIKASSRILESRLRPPSDVLWVAIRYRDRLPVLGELVAEELDDEGHTHYYRQSGGLLGGNGQVTVCKWPLNGGVCQRSVKLTHPRSK